MRNRQRALALLAGAALFAGCGGTGRKGDQQEVAQNVAPQGLHEAFTIVESLSNDDEVERPTGHRLDVDIDSELQLRFDREELERIVSSRDPVDPELVERLEERIHRWTTALSEEPAAQAVEALAHRVRAGPESMPLPQEGAEFLAYEGEHLRSGLAAVVTRVAALLPPEQSHPEDDEASDQPTPPGEVLRLFRNDQGHRVFLGGLGAELGLELGEAWNDLTRLARRTTMRRYQLRVDAKLDLDQEDREATIPAPPYNDEEGFPTFTPRLDLGSAMQDFEELAGESVSDDTSDEGPSGAGMGTSGGTMLDALGLGAQTSESTSDEPEAELADIHSGVAVLVRRALSEMRVGLSDPGAPEELAHFIQYYLDEGPDEEPNYTAEQYREAARQLWLRRLEGLRDRVANTIRTAKERAGVNAAAARVLAAEEKLLPTIDVRALIYEVSGRSPGDGGRVRVSLVRLPAHGPAAPREGEPNGDSRARGEDREERAGAVVVDSTTVDFNIAKLGPRGQLSAGLAFTKRQGRGDASSGPDPDDPGLGPVPSLGLLLHWGFREQGSASWLWKTLNFLRPGVGAYLHLVDFDGNQDVEVGIGVGGSLFGDLITVGYGWNASASKRREYFFFGFGLSDAFAELSEVIGFGE